MSVSYQLCLILMLNRFTDKDMTDYFRGIVKIDETSDRVLDLTEDIIRLNPAHYSAWLVLPNAPRLTLAR